jgi:hypothetical protein
MPVEISEILTSVMLGLTKHAMLLDDEHAVRGLDAMNELQLHALIGDTLATDANGVHREIHYPSDGDAYTKQTHRNRCDLVITPNEDQSLLDPVAELHQLAIAQDTLFAHVPIQDADPESTCKPEDAFWIEIKVCAQHAYRDGVPSPNGKYAHELLNGLQTDICKLSADPHIWHAASLIILFTESEEIARRDLSTAASLCIDMDLPVRSPLIETCSITDRGGNACLALGLFPISV